MNVNAIIAGMALLIASVFMIATSAIGMECYDKNESLKKDKIVNYNFLLANLVSAILIFCTASACIGVGATDKN